MQHVRLPRGPLAATLALAASLTALPATQAAPRAPAVPTARAALSPLEAAALGPLPAPRPHPGRPGRPLPEAPAPGLGAPKPFPAPVPGDTAAWTFIVYIVGDNDLEPYVVTDIENELAMYGSSPDVNVVVMADRAEGYDTAGGNWTGTKLFYVTAGMKATPAAALADLGERNMGDAATLTEFLTWTKTQYPAEHYALVFWDHGWGWRPGQSNLDEADADALDQDEILQSLEATGPVDVIGYDACLMQMLEVQATFRDHAKAIVASQDYVSGRGFFYEEILSALQARPEMDAIDLSILMSDAMRDRTISTTLLNEDWDDLLATVSEWAKALEAGLPKYRATYDDVAKKTQHFGDKRFVDLYDLAERLEQAVPDPAIRTLSREVRDGIERVVIDEWHRDLYYTHTHGLSIYLPRRAAELDIPSSPEHDFDYYRQQLLFSGWTAWDEFLAAYTNR